MLRTRLYLGLLPLLLLFVAVGLATMYIAQDLAHSMEKRLAASYSWMIGCYDMSEQATLMVQALHDAQNGRVLESKKDFYQHRGQFQRALMDQSFSSAGLGRASAVGKVVDAFDKLSGFGEDIYTHGAAASLQSYQQTEAALFRTLQSLKEVTEFDYAELRSETNRAARVVQAGINVLVGSLVGGILLSRFLSYRGRWQLGSRGTGDFSRRAGRTRPHVQYHGGQAPCVPRCHHGESHARPAHDGGDAYLDA
jgi:hypothetical protein